MNVCTKIPYTGSFWGHTSEVLEQLRSTRQKSLLPLRSQVELILSLFWPVSRRLGSEQ